MIDAYKYAHLEINLSKVGDTAKAIAHLGYRDENDINRVVSWETDVVWHDRPIAMLLDALQSYVEKPCVSRPNGSCVAQSLREGTANRCRYCGRVLDREDG